MTVSTPDITEDIDVAKLRAYEWGVRGLAVVVVGAFAISYYGIFHLLKDVGKLPWELSTLGPIVVDFFALVGIFTGHAMRRDKWTRRAYAWFVTLVATGLSMAGNAADAHHRHLDSVGTGIFAVAPPIIFLSSHLIVVCRRSVDEHRRATTARTRAVEGAADDDAADSRVTKPLGHKAYARQQAAKGKAPKDIYAALVVRGYAGHERNVARWTQDIRAAKPSDNVATPDEPATVLA